jgi:hypothetical protein
MTNQGSKNGDRGYWFERLMAAIALVNLLMVAFDLSYVPWRDFYLKRLPIATHWYGDRFKGIEPHRDTEAYLAAVDQLDTQIARSGLQSPPVREQLKRLRVLSEEMINENSFQSADKSGTLERIKNRMRDRTGQSSSHIAFKTFWSPAYLARSGWMQEITFFNSSVRPLIATNYYRNIGENGEYIDRFWQIDVWFIALFSAEFLTRTFYLSRRYRRVNWLDTVLWRWFDLFLLIPFWRWLRVIPVTMRLNQSRMVNLEPLRNRVSQGLITHFAAELTETVVLRVLEQVQNLIKQGGVTRWLLQPQSQYVDLNNVNEVEVIFNRLLAILVKQVLPEVRPDIEALVHHTISRVLQQNPVYTGLRQLPGFGSLSTQITEQFVAEVYQRVYGSVAATVHDPQGAKLAHTLLDKFGETLKAEVRREKTLQELEALVLALLEEVKVNYVDRISEQDAEGLQQQSHHLYEMMQSRKPLKSLD